MAQFSALETLASLAELVECGDERVEGLMSTVGPGPGERGTRSRRAAQPASGSAEAARRRQATSGIASGLGISHPTGRRSSRSPKNRTTAQATATDQQEQQAKAAGGASKHNQQKQEQQRQQKHVDQPAPSSSGRTSSADTPAMLTTSASAQRRPKRERPQPLCSAQKPAHEEVAHAKPVPSPAPPVRVLPVPYGWQPPARVAGLPHPAHHGVPFHAGPPPHHPHGWVMYGMPPAAGHRGFSEPGLQPPLVAAMQPWAPSLPAGMPRPPHALHPHPAFGDANPPAKRRLVVSAGGAAAHRRPGPVLAMHPTSRLQACSAAMQVDAPSCAAPAAGAATAAPPSSPITGEPAKRVSNASTPSSNSTASTTTGSGNGHQPVSESEAQAAPTGSPAQPPPHHHQLHDDGGAEHAAAEVRRSQLLEQLRQVHAQLLHKDELEPERVQELIARLAALCAEAASGPDLLSQLGKPKAQRDAGEAVQAAPGAAAGRKRGAAAEANDPRVAAEDAAGRHAPRGSQASGGRVEDSEQAAGERTAVAVSDAPGPRRLSEHSHQPAAASPDAAAAPASARESAARPAAAIHAAGGPDAAPSVLEGLSAMLWQLATAQQEKEAAAAAAQQQTSLLLSGGSRSLPKPAALTLQQQQQASAAAVSSMTLPIRIEPSVSRPPPLPHINMHHHPAEQRQVVPRLVIGPTPPARMAAYAPVQIQLLPYSAYHGSGRRPNPTHADAPFAPVLQLGGPGGAPGDQRVPAPLASHGGMDGFVTVQVGEAGAAKRPSGGHPPAGAALRGPKLSNA